MGAWAAPTWLPPLPSLIPVIPAPLPTRLLALPGSSAPRTSNPPFCATIVLVSSAVASIELPRPTPLPLTVQLVNLSVPRLFDRPPAELPLTVQLINVVLPAVNGPPL